ncbi:hypothetical protein [Paraburkholderia tropica]|uniref:hypothetical protein n=1 Tax=Paraburkholderia tropica TaxID=92647 RepID=UPI002AB09B4E|nr:hypothetical protein [Paraburkholderia tropica]
MDTHVEMKRSKRANLADLRAAKSKLDASSLPGDAPGEEDPDEVPPDEAEPQEDPDTPPAKTPEPGAPGEPAPDDEPPAKPGAYRAQVASCRTWRRFAGRAAAVVSGLSMVGAATAQAGGGGGAGSGNSGSGGGNAGGSGAGMSSPDTGGATGSTSGAQGQDTLRPKQDPKASRLHGASDTSRGSTQY